MKGRLNLNLNVMEHIYNIYNDILHWYHVRYDTSMILNKVKNRKKHQLTPSLSIYNIYTKQLWNKNKLQKHLEQITETNKQVN